MFKPLKIVLMFLLIIVIALAAFVVIQYDNIKALVLSMNMSEDDLAIKIEENNQLMQNLLDKYKKYIPDEEQIGEATEEDIAKGPVEDSASSNTSFDTNTDTDIVKNEDKKQDSSKVVKEKETSSKETDKKNLEKTDDKNVGQKSEDEIISKYVNTMYSLKNDFISKLSELEELVKKEYIDLPAEKRTLETKKNLAFKYFDYVSNLEKTCDKMVYDNLKELEAELKKINADTAIVNDIKKVYDNEKTLQKAYYINLMSK